MVVGATHGCGYRSSAVRRLPGLTRLIRRSTRALRSKLSRTLDAMCRIPYLTQSVEPAKVCDLRTASPSSEGDRWAHRLSWDRSYRDCRHSQFSPTPSALVASLKLTARSR